MSGKRRVDWFGLAGWFGLFCFVSAFVHNREKEWRSRWPEAANVGADVLERAAATCRPAQGGFTLHLTPTNLSGRTLQDEPQIGRPVNKNSSCAPLSAQVRFRARQREAKSS